MEDLFQQIAQKLITKEDLLFFLEDINTAKELIFRKPDLPLAQKAKSIVSEEFREILKKLEETPSFSTKEGQIQTLDKLKKYLLSFPQIKLTLAFSPSLEFLKKISDWLIKETHQKVILDVFINPKITGGVIVEYKGKYLDLSLAKKIQQFLREDEPRI
jgi:F0F1-type ATP synthase delta subunit